jgi:hypothetical protein
LDLEALPAWNIREDLAGQIGRKNWAKVDPKKPDHLLDAKAPRKARQNFLLLFDDEL